MFKLERLKPTAPSRETVRKHVHNFWGFGATIVLGALLLSYGIYSEENQGQSANPAGPNPARASNSEELSGTPQATATDANRVTASSEQSSNNNPGIGDLYPTVVPSAGADSWNCVHIQPGGSVWGAKELLESMSDINQMIVYLDGTGKAPVSFDPKTKVPGSRS